eukprot:790192-Prorocentrum_minimum.AAC.4
MRWLNKVLTVNSTVSVSSSSNGGVARLKIQPMCTPMDSGLPTILDRLHTRIVTSCNVIPPLCHSLALQRDSPLRPYSHPLYCPPPLTVTSQVSCGKSPPSDMSYLHMFLDRGANVAGLLGYLASAGASYNNRTAGIPVPSVYNECDIKLDHVSKLQNDVFTGDTTVFHTTPDKIDAVSSCNLTTRRLDERSSTNWVVKNWANPSIQCMC